MGRNHDHIRKTFTFEGKRYEVFAATDSEAEVKKALKLRDLQEGKIVINGNTLVKDWITNYLETYKRNSLKDVSYTDLKSRINHNITAELGHMLIKEVRPIHCQKILNGLNGFSANHIKKVERAMFDIFEKALDNKMILSNPAAKLQKPKGHVTHRRALTDAERKIVLKVATYNRAGLWVLIMLYCGLRPNETSLVQGRHINRKNNTLHIEGTKTANADRIVPIPEVLIKQLPHLEPFQYLFVNQVGGKISDSNRRLMWLSFERDMNIEMGCRVYRNQIVPPYRVSDDLVPYCFRHTYCTDLQAAGVPINIAKELMGHSDISLTSKIYTHKSDESFQNASTLINQFQTIKSGQSEPESSTGRSTSQLCETV